MGMGMSMDKKMTMMMTWRSVNSFSLTCPFFKNKKSNKIKRNGKGGGGGERQFII